MANNEKIIMFRDYMRDKNLSEDVILYNCKVIDLLLNNVLVYFDEDLESIDTYTFEEFTDMTTLINEELGGREGIPRIMQAMLELTEFLKKNKLIKGGKIAYYKRMFSCCDYYLDKYDMMTGKKDNTKEFIKDITQNKFSSSILKMVEDINVYNFNVISIVDKILNDIPLSESERSDKVIFIKYMLENLNLIEEKSDGIDITKKGRMLSRLDAEERYAALLDLMFYHVQWNNMAKAYNYHKEEIKFNEIIDILISIFYRNRTVSVDLTSIIDMPDEQYLIEIAEPRFRMTRIESMALGSKILDVCFVDMGLLKISTNNKEIIYSSTELGQSVFKLLLCECKFNIKSRINSINYLLKSKNYDEAETKLLEYLSIYGGNTIVWDYLGQILMRKKDYKNAYMILKNGYEKSSKNSKASKSILYHLVLCCRKLKFENDIKNYEKKLQSIEKV